MLVYGDAERVVARRAVLAGLANDIAALDALPEGIGRHEALVSALIEAGQLAQGLADAAAQAAGFDEISCAEQAAMRLVMALAEAVGRSWESGFQVNGTLPAAAALRRVESVGGRAQLTVKEPEGYAFYSLYPESYFAAARAMRGGPWKVIGVRSIGSSLSGMVAAALGAPPPLTVRPVGHPFQRRVEVGPKLASRLPGRGGEKIALVDEGPGLSGSSFGALADLLERNGAARERLHAFSGHRGELGPQASVEHAARWAALPRHVVSFDELWLREGDARHLRNWAADFVGPAQGPLQDISGGAWRARMFPQAKDWPAAHVGQERRKFLLRAGGRIWLLKFAGLGREGARKLALGKTLAEAGFTPSIAGLRHGFLVQQWRDDATPVDLGRLDRSRFLGRVADYLGFRARSFPAAGPGASIAGLLEMARFNARHVVGEQASPLDRWSSGVPALVACVRPVAIDGRMHPHEWLETPDGAWLKTDALDHHAAHDLVGCQDIAWDIAGTAVEFGLTPDEIESLRMGVERRAERGISPELVRFYLVAYLAFQLGRSTLAAASLAGMPEEQARSSAEAERYGRHLQSLLAGNPIK